VSAAGGGTGGGAGWHADPSGRFEHRWWDGYRWTDDVSTGGVAQKDGAPPQPVPTAPVAPTVPLSTASLLESPAFSIDISEGRFDGSGAWVLLDPAGAFLGRMVMKRRSIGSFDDWYVVEDAHGQLLLRLDTPSMSNDLTVHDAAGQLLGRLDITNTGLTLLVPGPGGVGAPGVVGTITLDGTGGFIQGPFRPSHADVVATTGQVVGRITIEEGQRGILDVGSQPPGTSWLRVDRDPAMPDPMRTLVAVAPIGLAASISGIRHRRRG
jgi:hypothetical protein